MGFVFQFYNLVQNLTSKENVELASEIVKGALDYQTGKQVLQILQDMCRKKGATVVIVTHNGAIAPIADRVIHMHDATVKNIEINKHPRNIAEIEW